MTASIIGGFAYSPINIEVNATDADGFVRQVDLVIDGQVVNSDQQAPYTFQWIPLEGKEYQISALARDDNGNIGASDAMVVSVEEGIGFMPILGFEDNRTSIPNILPPDSLRLGSQHILTVRAADDGGIANVEFFKNGFSVGFAERHGLSDFYSQTVSFADDEEGDVVFSAIARDSQGNQVGTFANAAQMRLHKTYRLLPALGATPPEVTILGPTHPVGSLAGKQNRAKRQRRASLAYPSNPTFSIGTTVPIIVQANAAIGARILRQRRALGKCGWQQHR